MLRWDDARTLSQKLANDQSTDAATFLDLMLNQGYKQVLSEFNSESIEEQRETTTVIDQRSYQAPVDALWISDLTIIQSDNIKYPLTEVRSRDTWDRITSNEISGIPEFYFVQPRKGIGGLVVQLEPIPSDEYGLIMVFETTAKDLSVIAHTTGTAAVNQDDSVVTGAGSPAWTSQMIGRYIRFTGTAGDGLWYKIAAVNSSTQLVLENYYQGANYSAGNYEIAQMFELPEDLHMAPVFYALWHYYASRRDKQQAAIYESQFTRLITDAHERHAIKTRDPIVHNFQVDSIMSDYPNWFPSDGVDP